ncbi:16S rRNA (cytosine(1402)-N(4))-methyltransferase, partial [bacterium G20]
MSKQKEKHKPVLLREVADLLAPQAGESYLDLTAGMGGHAGAILELTQAPERAILVDRDPAAVKMLKKKFKDTPVLQSDFYASVKELTKQGKKFDNILADLGVSSLHLNVALRGFSFVRSGPLDMRMDPNQALTAGEIVNTANEAQLASILREFGEERKSRQIAKNIVTKRPIHTT